MSKEENINEQQVLTCILNKPELIDRQKDCYFINSTAISIFNALKSLRKQNGDFLPHTVASVASQNNSEVTFELVRDLKEKVAYDINSYDYYSKRLREDFVKNNLATDVLGKFTSKLIQKGSLDPEVLLSLKKEVEDSIALINQDTDILSMKDLLNDYEKNLQNLDKSNHFTSSGDHWLDEKLYGGGLEYGQLACVFGRSGNGKSVFTEKLVNGKINMYDPILYIPTEMGRLSSFDRLIAMRTGLTISELTTADETGQIPEYVYAEFLKEKRKLLRNNRFGLIDKPISVEDLKDKIVSWKLVNNFEHITVFVDLASMLTDFNGDNKASKYEDAMNNLLMIAKETESAIVLVFQSKRKDNVGVDNYEDCKKYAPTIEELKNSGGIEERCRIVISVFRQKPYGIKRLGASDPEVLIADDIMDVTIQKQNNGPLAELHYLYNGESAHLAHIEEEKEEDN